MYAAQAANDREATRLTPVEARILEAFLDPEATFHDAAEKLKHSLKLTLQELLDALAGPAIRAAFDTLRELDALRRRLALAPIVPGALDALTRLLDKSENLVEVRRAATTILSTYTRLERGWHASPRRVSPRWTPHPPAVEGLDQPLQPPQHAAGTSAVAEPSTQHAARHTNGHAAHAEHASRTTAPDTSTPIGPISPLSPIAAPAPTALDSAPSLAAGESPRRPRSSVLPPSPAHLSQSRRGDLTCSPLQSSLAAAAGQALSLYALLPARAPPSHEASPPLRAAA